MTFTQRFSKKAQKAKKLLLNNKKEALLIVIILVVATLSHAWNMFGFPYYENDEATYTARAVTFISDGELDVYTYRYDHAPLGWMIMGLWFLVTGGTTFFDTYLVSGRVLMIVVHIISTLLLYVIAKRFSGGSMLAGTIAALIFSLSPLAVYFQRRILLDNLMILALLVSLYYLSKERLRLKDHIISAVTFGMAILIKLNAVFFGPVMLYLVWLKANKHHKVHALWYWIAFSGFTLLLFFLYALLKNELFSAPIGPDGLPTRVSVVDTFQLQLGRGEFAWPWQPESSFRQALQSWQLKDDVTLIIGTISAVFITFFGWFKRKSNPYLLASALLVWLYLLFLMRGKIVLDLYVAPIIPLFALSTGLAIAVIYSSLGKYRKIQMFFLISVFVSIGWIYAFTVPTRHYTVDETSNQQKAIEWIQSHISPDSLIVADNYVYPELGQQNDYSNVWYFFAAEYDPEIQELYGNDWRNIEYMVVTHEVMQQIESGETPIMQTVFDHSVLVADFTDGTSSFIDLDNYISTNGDWVQIYRVKDRNEIVLQDSWSHFLDTFIDGYGQVVSDSTNQTRSNDQAYAMKQALAQDEQGWFEGIWQWTTDHLRHRQDDRLVSWLWEINDDGEYSVGDSNTVCAADQKFAELLFKAAERWSSEELYNEATVITDDWWQSCVFELNGTLYVDSSADGSIDDKLINSGYFDPTVYRYLQTQSSDYEWDRLIDDGYDLLFSLNESLGTVPNWHIVTTEGELQSARSVIGDTADQFGTDSLMLIPGLINDYTQHDSRQAYDLLQQLSVDVIQLHSRQPESIQTNIILLLITQVIDTAIDPQKQYETAVGELYNPDEGYWNEGESYNLHLWSWFWHDAQTYLSQENRVDLW